MEVIIRAYFSSQRRRFARMQPENEDWTFDRAIDEPGFLSPSEATHTSLKSTTDSTCSTVGNCSVQCALGPPHRGVRMPFNEKGVKSNP